MQAFGKGIIRPDAHLLSSVAPMKSDHPPSLRHLRGDSTGDLSNVLYGVCELDGLEKIRKHVGYKAANALMTEVAATIRNALPQCAIGRVNRVTIEFAWRQESDAQATLVALRGKLPSTIALEGCALDVRPRLGFQQVSSEASAENAFEEIEAALADGSGARSDIVCVPAGTGDVSQERVYLLKEFSTAIAVGDLDVHYQPKLDCRLDRIASVEALLRWTHPTLGNIGPDRVIGAAEDTGLIRQVTFWVLARVLADLHALAEAKLALPIFVNISGVLLPDERFASTVIEMIRGNEHLIGFEITETAVIRDPEHALANLIAFRNAGISIAIDDYGTGLSSLAYLKQLPAQELKLDQLFISNLTSSHRDPLLVRSSIDLAHALEMKVTAEGVDDPMTLSLLTVMGCDMLQGYLISRPLPLSGLVEFLSRDSHVAHIRAAAPTPFARRG